MPSPAALFASILFGLIGAVAFGYGKKNASWRPMVVGVALVAFPYFVSETWLIYAIGSVLCVLLFVLRD
ncbi:MAG: hypothetical protein JWM03_1900 [Rhodocyclales bacterium]|nr:hypothetical protein [Rhodocyclales bacterium]MDB5889028.1 hypothetical protein [Rhodocyclales bacterium]